MNIIPSRGRFGDACPTPANPHWTDWTEAEKSYSNFFVPTIEPSEYSLEHPGFDFETSNPCALDYPSNSAESVCLHRFRLVGGGFP